MPFGISLSFDLETDRLVRSIWDDLASREISSSMIEAGYPPHMTLAVWSSPDASLVASEVQRIVAHTGQIETVIESIGAFLNDEGAVYLAPTVTSELLNLHGEICGALFDLNGDIREYYRPGRWIPHCTLATGLPRERVSAVVLACREVAFPINCALSELGIGRFPPGERLYMFPLDAL